MRSLQYREILAKKLDVNYLKKEFTIIKLQHQSMKFFMLLLSGKNILHPKSKFSTCCTIISLFSALLRQIRNSNIISFRYFY